MMPQDTSSNPTSVLREEHQVILRVLRVFSRLLDKGEQDAAWDFDAIGRCLTFFRLYADACHHGKEEDLLFPELEARGMPREGGPIGVMIYEHRLGRAHVQAMLDALPGARASERADLERLLEEGRAYVELLSAHIGKEDHCLFAMAEGMMDQPSCRGLCARYAEVSGGRFENSTKEDLERMAADLESGTQ